MSAELDRAADVLRHTIDSVAVHFSGRSTVLRDAAEDCAPEQPGRASSWAYTVSLPAPSHAGTTLHGSVVRALSADGWQAVVRDATDVSAVQFSRDGYDLGVLVGLLPGADVVVGGSTPCLPA